jgi:CRISPR-associated protein Csm3
MKKKKLSVKIEVLTGLHIGIGSDKPEIGGIDNPVIKDPISKLPYIPGSSIKGKLRSLLETESTNFNKKVIDAAFGDDENTPTRLIFRDISLCEKDKNAFNNGSILTEAKTEIKMNRKTGTAENTALRVTERVPAQVVFEGEILIRSIDDDDEKLNEALLSEAVKLLNNDYLGGSGSRGYGAVLITIN